MSDENPLIDTEADRTIHVLRSLVGAVPVVGPVLAETAALIPGQKLDRLRLWIDQLGERIAEIEGGLERLQSRLRTDEGTDLLEDVLVASTRAITDERRIHLSNLVANGLAAEDFDYDQEKILARLLTEVTDAELLVLTYYATRPTLGSHWHSELTAKNPHVLAPAAREVGLPQADQDRAVLQDFRKSNLERLGLLASEGRNIGITQLGRLLMRHIAEDEVLVRMG